MIFITDYFLEYSHTSLLTDHDFYPVKTSNCTGFHGTPGMQYL